MHFAEFRFEDGVCVAGAAEGGQLDAVPLIVDEGGVVAIRGATPHV
jgi:nitrite reductase/ring-hydroxylating ferredoxin subunit